MISKNILVILLLTTLTSCNTGSTVDQSKELQTYYLQKTLNKLGYLHYTCIDSVYNLITNQAVKDAVFASNDTYAKPWANVRRALSNAIKIELNVDCNLDKITPIGATYSNSDKAWWISRGWPIEGTIKKNTPGRYSQIPLKNIEVYYLQCLLRDEGFLGTEGIDSIYGVKTDKALESYMRNRGDRLWKETRESLCRALRKQYGIELWFISIYPFNATETGHWKDPEYRYIDIVIGSTKDDVRHNFKYTGGISLSVSSYEGSYGKVENWTYSWRTGALYKTFTFENGVVTSIITY